VYLEYPGLQEFPEFPGHRLYLVYLAIFLEAAWTRHFSEIFGVIIGTFSLLVTPLLVQPEILTWYIQAAATPPIYFQTPTLGSWLQRAEIMRPEVARLLPTIFVAVGYLLFALFKGKQKQLVVTM
jgi:hypothetical protein